VILLTMYKQLQYAAHKLHKYSSRYQLIDTIEIELHRK